MGYFDKKRQKYNNSFCEDKQEEFVKELEKNEKYPFEELDK